MDAEPVGERPRRLRRDAQANRDRLWSTAGSTFARLGPSTQLEDVARDAGLGVGTAYRHLGSRDAVLAEVVAQRMAMLAEIADRSAAIADPWRAMEFFLTTLAERYAGDRVLVALMNGEGMTPEQVARQRLALRPGAQVLVSRARAAGVLREDFEVSDIPLVLLALSGVAGSTTNVDRRIWERTLRLILDGLPPRRTGAGAMPVAPLTDEEVGGLGPALG